MTALGPRLPVLGLLASLMLAGLSAPAMAQVTYPALPEKYDVQARYRIRADRDERIRQYRSMQSYLKDIGFVATARDDADLDVFDPTAELLQGTIPSANARRILDDARILTAIALPSGMAIPEDGKKPVAVRLRIASGFGQKEQREFHDQTVRHLGFLGFQEGIGYDHAGHAIIRGSLPAENLLKLLKDLRTQPSGWFAPLVTRDQLPEPFRNTLPIRYVEVLPDSADLPVVPNAAPTSLSKVTPDVRAIFNDPAMAQQPVRLDLILEDEPKLEWPDLRNRIRTAADGIAVEGVVGVVVTIRIPKTQDISKLIDVPEIRAIRLPRLGSETGTVQPGTSGTQPSELLVSANVAALHAAGFQGDGVRVVIIGSDFSGTLPASARVIDYSAELNPDLIPLPMGMGQSVGATAAQLASAAAPKATLILIRIDPSAFHQLLSAARSAAGEQIYSEAMQTRSFELTRRGETLTLRRSAASEEYRKAFLDLSDSDKTIARRDKARKDLDQLLADELVFKGAVDRFTALKNALDRLRGTAVVINTLTWETGYPQDGLNELSRYIDTKYITKPVTSSIQARKQPTAPIWVQPASMALGRVWAGPFLDEDGNNILDFASTATALPKGNWTRELNFLQFAPPEGDRTATLPAGLKVRFTIQWREPQDPDGYVPREPVFPMTLRLLRQLDPIGKTQASDEFSEVAHSTGAPLKLLKTAASGAFEQTLEVTIPADGVYALRVEGRSAFEYQIPALRQKVEVSPRIVIEPADAATTVKGSVLFQTFNTSTSGVGIPGDSSAAITVGITTAPGDTRLTLTGAGPGLTLLTKPELVAPGQVTIGNTTLRGSVTAAALIGGSAASLVSSGVRVTDLLKNLGLTAGDTFLLPAPWLSTLSRSKSER